VTNAQQVARAVEALDRDRERAWVVEMAATAGMGSGDPVHEAVDVGRRHRARHELPPAWKNRVADEPQRRGVELLAQNREQRAVIGGAAEERLAAGGKRHDVEEAGVGWHRHA
jgi:hypothetical protein